MGRGYEVFQKRFVEQCAHCVPVPLANNSVLPF